MTRDEWIQTAESAVLDVITGSNSLEDLAKSAFEFLRNPIVITNERGEMFSRAKGCGSYNDEYWENCDAMNYMPINISLQQRDTRNVYSTSRGKAELINMEKASHRVMVCEAPIEDEFIRVLALESHHLFSEVDYEILEIFTAAVSYIVRETSTARYFLNSDNYLLCEMIKGRIGDDSYAAKCLGIKSDDMLVILVAKRIFTSSAVLKLSEICDYFESSFPDSSAVVYEGNAVLLINQRKSGDSWDKSIETARNFCRRNRIYCCISRAFSGLKNISDYYKQTVEILNLGISINDNGTVFLANNIYITYLISKAKSDINDLCYSPVFKLLEMDTRDDSSLLPALYAYVVTSGNCSQSAKLLGIHHNSMKARLNLLKHIIGENIDSILPALYISLKVLFLTQRNLMEKSFRVEFTYSMSRYRKKREGGE